VRRLLPLLVLAALPARAAAPSAEPPSPAAAAPAPEAAPPAPDPAYLPELVARARALHLADDAGWLRLGHWRRRWFGGWKSENDAPRFFRAPGGQLDPAAELEATLRGFFAPPPAGADELDDALCRFPARLAFLAGRLGIDPARLPPRPCPRQREFVERVKARSVTLVFSSYYLNNPASSFGHTFLRLNQTDEPLAGRTFEILDYGVDYSAQVDTGNALLYAVKGLLGLFKGTFNHYPYYYKVREYADYESRDLWEYDLALRPDEVGMLVAHLWELGGSWFDYWYLDENCSYHVLGALEAAAPRLELTGHVAARPLVVPADTVKALYRNPGLVRSVHYRPAMRTQFEARVRPLSARDDDAVEGLAHDAATPLPAGAPDAERAAVLDAALDLVDLRHGKALVMGTDPWAARARQALLERRAGLRVQSPALELAPPDDRRPDRGHGSIRAGLGGGAVRDGGGFATLDLRLCLHDLLDPPDGYPAHAQIEFLPARLRWRADPGRLELDDASVVRIVSLSPLTRFDRRPSWRARLGAETVRDAACAGCVAGLLDAGGGLAVSALDGAVDAAAFGDAELLGSPRLAGWDGGRLRVGLGPGGLVRLRLGDRAALLASGDWRWLPEARPRETFALDAALRVHLGRNLSVALEARRRPREDALGLALYAFDGL
jgi:hypothetical protein